MSVFNWFANCWRQITRAGNNAGYTRNKNIALIVLICLLILVIVPVILRYYDQVFR